MVVLVVSRMMAGPLDFLARAHLGAVQHRRLVLRALGPERHQRLGLGIVALAERQHRIGHRLGAPDRLDADGIDDQRLVRHDEAVLPPVRFLEAAP